MQQIGLKLWSTNEQYVKPALKLFANGVYKYIELYVEPDSLNKIDIWQELRIPFVLHAPHSFSGLNPSLRECESRNFKLIEQVDKYRKALNPKYIIFHPGVGGTLEETLRQYCKLSHKFPEIKNSMLIENKPFRGLSGRICIGSTPQEIKTIMLTASFGCCLDFGHAIAAANSFQKDWRQFVGSFLLLTPNLFHLSDNNMDAEIDSHLNFGAGNCPVAECADTMPKEAMVTLETEKDPQMNLRDFTQDVEFLKDSQIH